MRQGQNTAPYENMQLDPDLPQYIGSGTQSASEKDLPCSYETVTSHNPICEYPAQPMPSNSLSVNGERNVEGGKEGGGKEGGREGGKEG